MTTFAPDWSSGRLTREAATTALGGIKADGVLAERIVVPARGVVAIPADWSFDEAATLPCAGLTAWHALFEERPLADGSVVLTIGSGGVSCFALQFARRAGCQVIALSRDARKLERLHALGATFTIDSSTMPAWSDTVHTLSDGGVDHVVEVGGQGTLSQSIRATRHGGTISLIGTLARSTPVDLTPVLMRNICLQGIVAGSREMLTRMVATLADGSVRPVIDRVFPFADVPAAFAYLEDGVHVGKVIVRIP
jgi:NADPH:quinone reductase-like Zn-dependent oxidoreductase